MNKRPYGENVQYLHYENSPETHARVAHGVWGGINPYGEIEMCFYEESVDPPRLTVQDIGADGVPGPERFAGKDSSERHLKRLIHTRLVVNYNSARAMLAWLEERLAEMETESSAEIYDGNSGIPQ